MQPPSFPVPPEPRQPLSYARPMTAHPTYAGLYITFAILGIFLALLRLLFEAGMTIGIVAMVSMDERVPIEFVLFTIASVLVSLTLLVGSIASFWRVQWSRRMLLGFAKCELAVLACVVLGQIASRLILSSHGLSRFGESLGSLWLVIAIRAACAIGWWMVYSILSADFYFGNPDSEAAVATDKAQLQEVRQRMGAVPAARPAGKFRITGMDIRSGKMVTYPSNAEREEIARKSARALGLDPTTVKIESIASTPTTPSSPAPPPPTRPIP